MDIISLLFPPQNTEPNKYLLPPRKTGEEKKCIVIDLDETLVHSSFKVSVSVCPGRVGVALSEGGGIVCV